MVLLESNLEILSKRQADLARILSEACRSEGGEAYVQVYPSIRGGPTASYYRGGLPTIHLHSRYDPAREAVASVKRFDKEGADYFILLGFGLGYPMEALIAETSDRDAAYFVIESDIQILRAAFESRDLRELLTVPRIHFAWPPSGMELAAQWERFFNPVAAKKSIYISHAPSLAINPGLFQSAAQIIQSQIYQSFTDINTAIASTGTFLANFIANLPAALAAPGVAAFAGSMPHIPAVIVSAGPSLDKNVYELRGQEDRVLILATDTALKPLLAAGVEPHFILTGDPSELNYRHLEGTQLKSSLVVAEATAYPGVFTQFAGRTIACTYDRSTLAGLTDLLAAKGKLRAWGSVATMVLDFALALGCAPIIFIGQDLAHTDGRIYCSGVTFENEWFEGVTSPEEWQKRCEQLRASRKTVHMVDIFGRTVETTDKLAAYWNWISAEIGKHPEIEFINATEGGILREGVTIMSLREALYRFGSEPRPLVELIAERFRRDRSVETSGAANLLRQLRLEAGRVRASLSDGLELCRQEPDQSSFDQLSAAKQAIYEARRVAPLLDALNQLGNLGFLRGMASLPSRGADGRSIQIQRSLYSDFFTSVMHALDTVESALHEIQKILA